MWTSLTLNPLVLDNAGLHGSDLDQATVSPAGSELLSESEELVSVGRRDLDLAHLRAGLTLVDSVVGNLERSLSTGSKGHLAQLPLVEVGNLGLDDLDLLYRLTLSVEWLELRIAIEGADRRRSVGESVEYCSVPDASVAGYLPHR